VGSGSGGIAAVGSGALPEKNAAGSSARMPKAGVSISPGFSTTVPADSSGKATEGCGSAVSSSNSDAFRIVVGGASETSASSGSGKALGCGAWREIVSATTRSSWPGSPMASRAMSSISVAGSAAAGATSGTGSTGAAGSALKSVSGARAKVSSS
jgi:hypothetical protein